MLWMWSVSYNLCLFNKNYIWQHVLRFLREKEPGSKNQAYNGGRVVHLHNFVDQN
jgi:hypothetical protein